MVVIYSYLPLTVGSFFMADGSTGVSQRPETLGMAITATTLRFPHGNQLGEFQAVAITEGGTPHTGVVPAPRPEWMIAVRSPLNNEPHVLALRA